MNILKKIFKKKDKKTEETPQKEIKKLSIFKHFNDERYYEKSVYKLEIQPLSTVNGLGMYTSSTIYGIIEIDYVKIWNKDKPDYAVEGNRYGYSVYGSYKFFNKPFGGDLDVTKPILCGLIQFNDEPCVAILLKNFAFSSFHAFSNNSNLDPIIDLNDIFFAIRNYPEKDKLFLNIDFNLFPGCKNIKDKLEFYKMREEYNHTNSCLVWRSHIDIPLPTMEYQEQKYKTPHGNYVLIEKVSYNDNRISNDND